MVTRAAGDGHRRLVLDVPDNAEEFGRCRTATAPSPYPQVRLVAVGECGTHGIVDAAFGPVATGEQTLAGQLISRFTSDMLALADRNFYGYQAWQQGVAAGAQLLWRVSASLRLPVLTWLPDGSYLSVLINPNIRSRRREQLLPGRRGGRGGARPRPGHGGPGVGAENPVTSCVCVPRTVSPPLISAFTAGRPEHQGSGPAQHDRWL